MPINVTTIVGLVALGLGIAVWAKTRRVGPVAGVMVAAFIVVAMTDASTLKSGGDAVSSLISWALTNVLSIGGQ